MLELLALGDDLGALAGLSGSEAMRRAHDVLHHVGLGEAVYRDVVDIRSSTGPYNTPPPPSENLNLLLGVVGAKVNIPGTTLLLNASVLFPLTKAGLQPKVTFVGGIDYAF